MKTIINIIIFLSTLSPLLHGKDAYPSIQVLKDMPPLHFGQTLEEVRDILKVEPVDLPPYIHSRKGIDKSIVYKNLNLNFDTGLLSSITINRPFTQFQGMGFFCEKWKNFDRDGISVINPGFTRNDLEAYLPEWTARAIKNGAKSIDASNTEQDNLFKISKRSNSYTDNIYIEFGTLQKTKYGTKIWSGGIGFHFETEDIAKALGVEVGSLSSIHIYCNEFNTWR